MIGKTISHYHVLEKIGSGGMGEVYLAEDTKLKRTVALKFLAMDLTRDSEAKKRFEREAQAAAALNHPNIVTVYEIGELESQVFIAMEHVEGKTLKEIVSADLTPSALSPMPIPQVLDIAIQLASGLAAAHAKGIVHRDIKPQNIVIDRNGRVKILDFGLAKLKGVSSLTKESSTLGTVHYMSPEQTMGKEVDQRSDIWSLGVVIYEMLTGKLPFKGEYEQAVIYSILNEEPEPVQDHRPDLSPEFSHIVSRVLDKSNEDRYQSAGDMLIDLKRLKRDSDRVTPGMAKGIPAAERAGMLKRKRNPFWIDISLAAIVAVVTLGYFVPKLFRGPPEATPLRKNSIAVMYFEDRSGEDNFGRILSEMLISNLSRCKDIEVVSSQHLFDIMKRMKIEDSATISRSMATAVARNAGVGTMLLGSIDRIGDAFSVNAQLCSVGTGSVIGPAQARGPRVEDVYEMVNRLTEEVIQLMDVRQPGDGQALRINDITTRSFEAYKHYQKGNEQLRRFNFRGASEEFAAAIRIDGTFVMAQVSLAFSRDMFKVRDPFSDLAPARQALRLARQLDAGISGQEREFIQVVDAMFRRDFASMIDILESAVRNNPDSRMFPWWLGFAQTSIGNLDAAIQTLQRLIAADPENVNAHLILAYSHSRRNDHEEAIAAIRNYVALLPDVLNSYDSACDIHLKAGLYDDAYRVCDEALKANPEWTYPIRRQCYIHLIRGEGDLAREKNRRLQELQPAAKLGLIDDLGCFALHEGRYRQAEAEFRMTVQLAVEQKNSGMELEQRLVLGRFYGEQGKFSQALEQFSRVKELSLEAHGHSYNAWPVRADYYWGLAALRAGRTDECRAAMERIQRYVKTNRYDEILIHFRHLLLAEIETKSGHVAEAAAALSRVAPFIRNYSPHCRLLAAEILALQGEIPKAEQAYADLADDWETTYAGQAGDFFDYWQIRSMIKYKIARLNEISGDRAQAVAYYQQALSQWKSADADMPEYVDARTRLARLNTGE